MDDFEAANRRAIAERLNDENITNLIIRCTGQPLAYEPGSPYYHYRYEHEALWVDPPFRRGYEPITWRIIDPQDFQAMENALKGNFIDNSDGPLDPETFIRLHRMMKLWAYYRMFYMDIVAAEMPWKNPGPGGWKWWSTKEGREGRKIIRRKIKYYILIFAWDWILAKRRDFAWLVVFLPKFIDAVKGQTATKAAKEMAVKMAENQAAVSSG
ncbi:hypothetical protein E6O75_ATG10388 [Venturia nashicola]|uniref:Uncharacterized protein n=1 Tax=Venturia nashicola TaxID=86259 RepID=A0A4Z1P6Q5_9PEZI|nr:hypothetical protein E6O75_ATG10388 [Venturia nashicola]